MIINTDELDAETAQRIQDLGAFSIAEDAYAVLNLLGKSFQDYIISHVQGDYGTIPDEMKWQNDVAMYQRMGECKSVYVLEDGQKLVVVTRWNQPVTKVLLEDNSEDL